MKKRWLIAGVLVLLLVVTGIVRLGRAGESRNRLRLLRDSVQMLRTAADECTADLDQAQAHLVEYRRRLDTLHAGVREFEAADPRGVPIASYEEYMNAFGAYNDSAAAWQGRVDTLQVRLEQCQSLAAAHNEAVDSLRTMLTGQ